VKRILTRLPLAAVLALGAAACSDSDEPDEDTGVTDTGGDAATDTGADTGLDTGTDTGADTGTDTGADTGEDVTADTGADTTGDVGQDTGGEEGLVIPGLSATTTVYFDDMGVPHIECATDADCTAALGYVHARDRFAQMDLRRRVTTGRLGQLVGELAFDVDRANRTVFSTRDGVAIEDALVASATPETLALLQAYSDGVNAWLADLDAGRNDAVLQDEYGFALVDATNIPPWEPQDSLATVVALVNSLTNDSARELRLGEYEAAVAADVFHELYGPWLITESNIIDDYTGPGDTKSDVDPIADTARYIARSLPALREARATANALYGMDDALVADRGSNNWVVGPSQTASGNALLANDPHLGLSNPSLWYMAHMDAVTNGEGTLQVAGQSFAGLPWIVIGQNADIAWGATNTNYDFTDVYEETLSEDGTGVIFDGEVVPFAETEFTFEFSDAEDRTETLLFVPHHGPVLSIDRDAGVAYTLRWTGNDLSTDVNFLTELQGATDIDEARTALRNITSIGQNWVVIDRAGSIGWFPYNTVPVRPWASLSLDSWTPLPGDGTAEWDGYFAYEDLPQALNPDAGYLATANNDMTGAHVDGDPTNDGWPLLQSRVAPGYRHARIVERLEADAGAHTPETMASTIADTVSLAALDVIPLFQDVLAERDDLPAGIVAKLDELAAWDGTCPTGIDGISLDDADSTDAEEAAASRACAIFHVMLVELHAAMFGDEVEAEVLPGWPDISVTVRWFVRPETFTSGTNWVDDTRTDATETADELVVASLQSALDILTETLGEDVDAWRWGRIHTLTLRADLFADFGVPTYNNGPVPNDGGLWTVDVANPSFDRAREDGTYDHRSGASTRWICEASADAVDCSYQLPGGQRHFRDSDNYEDGFTKWLRNEPTAMITDLTAIAADAAYTLEFAPSGE